MERPLSKREKVIASCRHYKEVVKKWEVALQKTEGRKPGKDDIKTAPENVQKAYVQYKKLAKYLETHGSSSNSVSPRRKGQHLGISPKKIFGTGGSSDYVIRRNTLLNSFPERRSRVNKDYNMSASDRLNLKISSAITLMARRKKESENGEKKSSSSTIPAPGQSASTCPGSPAAAAGGNGCVISAIWQSLSPSPKSKRRKTGGDSSLRIRQVDSGWLDRVGQIEAETEKLETDILDRPKEADNKTRSSPSHETSDEALDIPEMDISLKLDEFDFGEEENGFPEKQTQVNTSLFAPDFQNFLKSTPEPSFCETSVPSCYGTSIEFNETQSGDSGIGMPTINSSSSWESCQSTSFATTEPMDAVFHDEDACCFPPPLALQTVDMDAVTNLLSENSYDFGHFKQRTPNSPSNRKKRTNVMAFSPSPKKPSPKKKFFKSDRTRVRAVRYAPPSFKPPSPLKKKKEALPVPSTTTTNVTSKKALEETQPVSIQPSVPEGSKACLSSHKPQQSKAASKQSPGTKLDESNFFNESVPRPATASKKKTYKSKLTGKAAFQRKVNSGNMNENFVKIDLKKKVFVRGHKKLSGSKMKREDWKLKKAAASKEEILSKMKCRKCGEAGHFAKFCVKDQIQKDEPDEIDESPFPTLEEAAHMLKGHNNLKTTKVNIYPAQDPATGSESSTAVDSASTKNEGEDKTEIYDDEDLDSSSAAISPVVTVQPYFQAGSTLEDSEATLDKAIRTFGHQEFRPGQREAITRVLKGLSTLVILSTGSGKSLCYQLPAYLYAKKYPGALAICVSPLVSLMEDQVLGLPDFLQAACLHSHMPSSQKDKVIEKVRSKKLHILLVSPEAVCSGLFGLLRNPSDLPLISFACIDEVHCLSQWSHNFRPCYLQLTKILRERLKVTTILGLTATATDATAASVCQHLRIDPLTSIRGEIIPRNLNLSVSRDTIRDEALLSLLRGERFKECDSMIVYCTRREECERLATLIRTCLQGDFSSRVSKVNGRSKVSTACEAYHAGMTAYRRKLVQQEFMSGKIKIVVATVAFGMGIDKSDIRSVIHYNMPKTFESYVQEVGRAGRDGLPAHCHLFLENAKGKDLSELRRHVYSNSVDRPTLRKLIRKVFQPCKCDRLKQLTSQSHSEESNTTETPSSDKSETRRCPGHEVSFVIADVVEDLDLPEENILTLLCYLELSETRKWVELLPHVYQTCKIHSYGGAKLLKSAALKSPPLAAAIALAKEKKRFKDSDSYLEFNVIEVASTLGWNSGIVKRELKNLEWTGVNFDTNGASTKYRKSAILVEFADLAFHLNAPGDLTDEETDDVLDFLHTHNTEQEKSQLYQLNRVFQSLLSVSHPKVESVVDGHDEEKSKMLKQFICEYFAQSTSVAPVDWKCDTSSGEEKEEDIRRDVVKLLSSTKDCVFTGRSVAKIFQGISSPNFPNTTWGRNRAFWRKYIDVDFSFLCQIAGQEIIRFR